MRLRPPQLGWFVLLALVCAILLAFGSAMAWRHASQAEDRALRVVQRADSLVAEWVSRGCAPRTKALP